ncbi:MAG: hypothetical protein KKA05_10475 [Alphaproteobacteria bacterium]|nr:hypothetical protein [Alphaproteobacteria bacterium]MBU0860336.1 hypothetical protein [Alphaproteobacteria bacterium]
MLRITDLDKFALEHIWRPYQSMMGHERRLEKSPMSLDETAALLASDKTGWAICVLNRLHQIGVTFPPYVKHPLVGVVAARSQGETLVPDSIEGNNTALGAVFLILEDWSCQDLSVAEAYAKIVQTMGASSELSERRTDAGQVLGMNPLPSKGVDQ